MSEDAIKLTLDKVKRRSEHTSEKLTCAEWNKQIFKKQLSNSWDNDDRWEFLFNEIVKVNKYIKELKYRIERDRRQLQDLKGLIK